MLDAENVQILCIYRFGTKERGDARSLQRWYFLSSYSACEGAHDRKKIRDL